MRAEGMAEALRAAGVNASAGQVQSTVGGGSLPGETLPSWAVALSVSEDATIDALARRLRLGPPGVFGRIERDRLLLDLRTVLPEDDDRLAAAVRAAYFA